MFTVMYGGILLWAVPPPTDEDINEILWVWLLTELEAIVRPAPLTPLPCNDKLLVPDVTYLASKSAPILWLCEPPPPVSPVTSCVCAGISLWTKVCWASPPVSFNE